MNMYTLIAQQLSSNTHDTRPKEDPSVKVPTSDEFVADYKEFVEASFGVADLLGN